MRHILSLAAVLLAGLGPHALAAAKKAPPKVVTSKLDTLPTNKWTTVYSGPPGIIGVYARFLWLPDTGRGLIWPCYNYRTRAFTFERHALLHFYSPAEGKWTTRPSTFPKDFKVDPAVVGHSCVYLPGIKRVLFLRTGRSRKLRVSARSWLLDPKKAAWQALLKQPPMCDSSKKFNPSRGADGSSVPLWGALVYDAHNREAVSIGGGGTWGRVGKESEKVEVGDWIYDETGSPKRIRRLTQKDGNKVTEARKWYPANCGTWVFPEAGKTWAPIAQPLGEQPPGRVLPGAAYDAAERKIVLFGGDNSQRCFRDTWIYDSRTRKWSEAKPQTSPPARAGHATLYVRGQKVVLIAGGYGPGWVPRKDVWVYDTARNTWTKLALDLPFASRYCSAAYDPASRAVLLAPSRPRWGMNRATTILGLRLDLKSAPRAKPAAPVNPDLEYHCRGKRWGAPLPAQWNSPRNRPGDREAGRRELAALPANTWVRRSPPVLVRARQWGRYIYDIRTHRGYAWGGGHYGYIGAEVSEYDVLTNRWRSMDDVVNYKLFWRHGAGGGSPGVSFQGWRLMGTHARKSYAVDPLSNSVITLHGDVFSIDENRFVANIGRCPGGWGLSGQHAYVTTPHGLYSFAADRSTRKGGLRRANVAAGRWDLVATGGPSRHQEYDTVCYDARRDRIIYIKSKGAAVWSFEFKGKSWAQEKPVGGAPPNVYGDTTYVNDLDAVMLVFATGRKASPRMYFYKLAERKWYTAPYRGAKVGWYANLNNSPCYDPELKLVVRMTHTSRERFVEVAVMRLDRETLELSPFK